MYNLLQLTILRFKYDKGYQSMDNSKKINLKMKKVYKISKRVGYAEKQALVVGNKFFT